MHSDKFFFTDAMLHQKEKTLREYFLPLGKVCLQFSQL
jgi:hypothetical protein